MKEISCPINLVVVSTALRPRALCYTHSHNEWRVGDSESKSGTHRFNFFHQGQALALGDVELQFVELCGNPLYQLTAQLPETDPGTKC